MAATSGGAAAAAPVMAEAAPAAEPAEAAKPIAKKESFSKRIARKLSSSKTDTEDEAEKAKALASKKLDIVRKICRRMHFKHNLLSMPLNQLCHHV